MKQSSTPQSRSSAPAASSGTAGLGQETDPLIFFEFPKTRLGNAVRKNFGKGLSWLGQLTTERWKTALRENSLRGVLRAVAGLAQELEKAESPSLAAKNKESLQLINDLLHLCSAYNALAKNDETKNVMKFLAPVSSLTEAVATHLGPSMELDAELQILQAAVCMCVRVFGGGGDKGRGRQLDQTCRCRCQVCNCARNYSCGITNHSV